MTEIGKVIRKIRNEKHLTINALSELANCSRYTLWSIEKTSNGTLYSLRNIADALGYEVRLVKKQ